MYEFVARSAKRNQVILGVLPGVTAKLPVVNLEIRQRAATLASPSVAAKHLLP
jgi:hypothetical protein